MELKEIGPVSSAKVMGILYAGIGLIAGVLFACVALAGAALGNGFECTNRFWSGMFGVGAIVVLAVL